MKFDMELLSECCVNSTSFLKSFDFGFGKRTETSRYVHYDNGGKILAVVHLDTVQDCYYNKLKQFSDPIVKVDAKTGQMTFTSIQLDDRLGLYYLLYVLPGLGINYDILMTMDEEVGRSSANEFVTTKDYNWVFQFDRHGFGNVVMYQYENKHMCDLLEDVGYDVQIGTFSDISSLEHLGVKGFNFGCGYINEHNNWCSTRTDWMAVCVNMFVEFYTAHVDEKFVHVKTAPKNYRKSYSYYPTKSASDTLNNYVKQPDGSIIWDGGTTSASDVYHPKYRAVPEYCTVCQTELYADEKTVCTECANIIDMNERASGKDKTYDPNLFCEVCGVALTPNEMETENYGLCDMCYERWIEEDEEGVLNRTTIDKAVLKSTCISCGIIFNEDDLIEGYCGDCLHTISN